MRNKTLIANDENGPGDSAVVMRCAAAKDDVRKLEAHGLSVPAARQFVTLRASANNVMRKLEAHGLSVPAARRL